jgi:hypothetical protein
MITVPVILTKTFRNETRAFGPVAVPVGLSMVRLSVDVSQMVTPDQFFDLNVDLSLDDGATWAFLFGFTRIGGIIINQKTQLVDTQSMMQLPLPSPALSTRRVRGTLVVTGTVPLSALLEAV